MSLFNEEAKLPRWIAEGMLSFVDAYTIAVDDKTTDSTRDILRKSGIKFCEFRFSDFSQMTNEAIDRLSTDYVLTVAPDEWFEGLESLRKLVESTDAPDLYLFPRYQWANLERTEQVANPVERPDDWQPRLHRRHVRFRRTVHEWPWGQRTTTESRAITIHHYAPYYERLDPTLRPRKEELYARLQA